MHLAGMLDEVRYETGFIDKVTIIIDEFLEIGDTLFQFLFHDKLSVAWFWTRGKASLPVIRQRYVILGVQGCISNISTIEEPEAPLPAFHNFLCCST